MRSNPLYYLTEKQLRTLALMEHMTVAEVLAKYDRIRPLSSRPRSAAAKVGESRKAARANPIHYLTDAQLKALALSERTTVAGVLAKYDRIRPISARAAAKGGGSRKAVANPRSTDVYVVLRRGVVIGVYSSPTAAKQVLRETPGATYQSAELFGR
jgi:hypothetical protein